MSQSLTIIGNLADEPELRFTATGTPVATFRVITSRGRKQEDGTYASDGITGWTVAAWEQMAENIAETLHKGDPVIVYGRAEWRSWEKPDGTKGGRLETTAWHVGLDLKRRSATVHKVERAAASSPQSTPDQWAQSAPPPF